MKTIDNLASGQVLSFSSTESPIERLMLGAFLRSKYFTLVDDGEPQGEGLFIYPQREVGPYRADFIIVGVGYKMGNRVWPPNVKIELCVECDGREFHSTPEARKRDRERDEYFKSLGMETLRFTGSMIYSDSDYCVRQVREWASGVIYAGGE